MGLRGFQASRLSDALFGLELVETDAVDAAGGAGKAQVDDLAVQTDDLEQLRSRGSWRWSICPSWT